MEEIQESREGRSRGNR